MGNEEGVMEKLLTIGYTKKSLEDFIGRLRRAGVDCVVDIRLQNTSQLAGFAKRDDLEFLLKKGFGIDYVHIVEFAPTQEMLDHYHKSKSWDDYRSGYSKLIDGRKMVELFQDMARQHGWKRPCLLCAEDKADTCHRRLLAEAIADAVPGLEVEHL